MVEGHGHNHEIADTAPKIRRVLVLTLFLNEAVAVAKILYGYVSGSIGMVSDGFHSFFDGFSNVVGLVGIWIASRPPDERHPYGHKKYESFFTIIIAVMIFGTCAQILHRAYESVFLGRKVAVTGISFLVMAVTLLVNLFVMRYESQKGRELGSDFLIADAMHTKSDILTSLSVIAGLFFARAGYIFADTLAGLIIAFFIARIGYKIIRNASDTLVDTVCLDSHAIENVVKEVKGVRGCHEIRTRGLSRHVYMDLHILVDPKITTEDSHRIAEEVEKKIKDSFNSVVDIVVHVEPSGEESDPGGCPSTEPPP